MNSESNDSKTNDSKTNDSKTNDSKTLAESITLELLSIDPHPLLAALRQQAPIAFLPKLGMWFATTWNDVATICNEPVRFRSNTEPSWLRTVLGENMLTLDGSAHDRLSNGMRPPFASGGAGGELQRILPQRFDLLIDELITTQGHGPVDLMTHYAEPLANISLQLALGFDSISWQQLAAWCRGLCAGIANFENDPLLTNLGEQAKDELGQALDSQLETIMQKQAKGISVHGGLAHFVSAGFSRNEIVNNVRLMISGGINEPRDGVGLVMYVLLTMPEVLESVKADRGVLRRVIEETFRFHTPVGTATRQAVGDQVLNGVTIADGELIAGVLTAANRDPQRWENPNEFRLDRSEGAHMAFAMGEHRCLGEWIGRQQVRIGVERLLDRLPNLRLAEEPHLSGFEFRGPTSLAVTW